MLRHSFLIITGDPMNKLTIKLSILSLILSLSLSAEEDWSRVNTCKYSYGANDNLITELLSKMSIEQKVGQVIQGDLDFISPADVKKYHIGSVLNGGNTAPNRDKYSTADDWKKLSQEFYDASIEVDGVKIPVLWGTDAVHGHNNLIGATLFPHNIGLGATANAALLKDIGEAIALEVLSTGVAWTFAPTVAVPQDDRWGRTYEGFSENPELVSKLGKAMIVGLQGEGTKFLDNNHVIATAKHFMGDGGTINGVDQGDAIVSEAELREIHGYPYFQALDACAQTVMASFNSINGSKMHGDKRLLTGILKDQMQFDGFVVGDWNGHGQVKNCSNVNCAQAFNAGVDMFMVPEEWKLLLKNTIRQVKSGEISLERLDDAVRRILTVKSRMGLLNGRAPHEFTSNYLGHPDHLALARQAVRESLVLLKNNNQMLPLNPSDHVGVIGEAANKISSQTGGWTITWQGRENKNSDFVNTKTIYQSIVDVVTSAGGTIEFSKDGNFINSPDYVIGIFGEEPYAEMLGDLKDVSFSATDPSYLPSLQALKAQEIPVVSLFLSGRPLEVNQYINASEAFVATWLPGTAVEGISDVIFLQDDEIGFDFKGKLSYSWPKSKAQSLLNAHHDLYEPLFPFGYGLDYRSQVNLPDIAIVKVNQKIDLVNIFLGAAAIPGQEFILSKTGPEFVSSDEFISQDGKISISRFDYLRQDDAKNFLFNKSESMQGFGVSTKSPLDITSMRSPHYELIMRINDSEKEPLYFNVTCGQNCQGTVKLPPMDLDTWNTVSVPVSCLEKDGLDTSTIQIRALFFTKGLINFDLHSVAIKSGATSDLKVSC